MTTNKKLNIAYPSDSYNVVTLVDPTEFGYIHLAAEVDRRHPFLPMSQKKRALLKACKKMCQQLAKRDDVQSAIVFKALLIPPGQGDYLKQRPEVHVARFDLSILIETPTVEAAEQLRTNEAFKDIEKRINESSNYTHIITASNVRRIGPVDHQRNGVFLFNYFYADDVEQNLAVWNYTAGWFEQETQLDNSTLLLPQQTAESDYTIVNHCRWDRLTDILPSILFKPTFRSYVLGNFEANRSAPIPILYRLA
ncbi:MAG: hypothetical protein AAF490_26120 [Chloroflexota bacterium]